MIQVETGAISRITIDRPDVHNALDMFTLRELDSAVRRLSDDDSVRCLVVTGAGDSSFVAGGDIRDLNSRGSLGHYLEFAELVHRVMRGLEDFPVPTIAAVSGYALGGGAELLLSLDLRVVDEECTIGFPEIALGLFPGAGGSQRVMRQLPACAAKELLYTGRRIRASEAIKLGLVNRVVPRRDLQSEVESLAEDIASKPPLALRLLKQGIRHGPDMPLSGALAYEQALVSILFDSKDAHEGCLAFLEHRRPEFTGT